MYSTKYMPDDEVKYTGSKFRNEIGGKTGKVLTEVEHDPGKYVVSFEEDAFILPVSCLSK